MRRVSRLVTVIKHPSSILKTKNRLLRRVPSTSDQSSFTAQDRDELKIRVTVGVFPQGDPSNLRKDLNDPQGHPPSTFLFLPIQLSNSKSTIKRQNPEPKPQIPNKPDANPSGSLTSRTLK